MNEDMPLFIRAANEFIKSEYPELRIRSTVGGIWAIVKFMRNGDQDTILEIWPDFSGVRTQSNFIRYTPETFLRTVTEILDKNLNISR